MSWAITAWGMVLVVVCVRAIAWPRTHSVYPILANAARSWSAGESLYAQDHRAQADLDVYRYSPLVATGLVPLSALSDPPAGALWRLLNATVLLTGLGWWCRACLPRRWPWQHGVRHICRRDKSGDLLPRWPILFLLVLPLCIGSLNNAQSNPLVLGLVLAGVAGASERRWSLTSACIALACLFKLYPIAVGLLLVIVYPRQVAGRLALALAVGLTLPFLLQQPAYVAHQYSGWLASLGADDRSTLSLERCYRDLTMLGRLWHFPISSGWYRILQAAAGAGLALVCLPRRNADRSRRQHLTLLTGLGCCWMTVLGPATESCTYILLAPSIAWEIVEAWERDRPIWFRIWPVGAYGLLVAAAMSCWFPGPYHLQTFGLQPLAGLMFLIYLLVKELGARRGATSLDWPRYATAERQSAPQTSLSAPS
jgi:hypothetical protein